MESQRINRIKNALVENDKTRVESEKSSFINKSYEKPRFFKRYWLLMLLLTLCPVAVNYIVLTPNFLPIVGDSDNWLSFFGSFIGSAIMAGITLYVLQEQLEQNQRENCRNRENNRTENESNRLQSQAFRLQEIELKWFDDLKQACSKLYSAFSPNEVAIASDLDPLSDSFHGEVARLINRMNEAYFNFQLVVNYHKECLNIAEAQRIQHLVEEYLALLGDMHGLHIYGVLLKKGLEEIDYTPDELEIRFKDFILKHKKEMEFPDISENRVWDLLIDDKFDKLECIPQILKIFRQRIDNLNMLTVGNSITELVKTEYGIIKGNPV